MKSPHLLAFLMPLFVGCSPSFEFECDNEVSQTLASPDGKHKAVVFSRECGATTGFSTQISVIGTSEQLPDDGGNVLVMDEDQSVFMRWQNANSLVISYPSGVETFNKQSRVNGVRILFKTHK
ncbi:hypothetical protein EON83_22495 [bacterium]|nr:MAG: hypothetical protein EON83_22495 [bacterium]